jgi:subfamily B ATP-binding cassette protein HlyB/CyaB
LRRQVAVVEQDNPLFNASIRENIAGADPGAPMEQVVRVARLAGAHDFIMELPEGYETIVGESGGTLSGGQRQRIAIARALFGNPRILIMDEATSALDYESEQTIRRNMLEICRDRTVLVIAHRLTTVSAANWILVLDRGKIVEQGSHQALLAGQGLYARMHALQSDPPGVCSPVSSPGAQV